MIAATVWGAAIAAVQLGLSWQFADSVRQTKRSAGDLIYYSFPPLHWFELVLPRLIRELRLGPEDPYWFGQQTWGYEAALYVGTIPLVFAFIGVVGRPASRSAVLWRILVPVSFALATMPRWWPQGYLQLLALPGIGYFRVPARYTLLTSFGLAILAGEGFELRSRRLRFRWAWPAARLRRLRGRGRRALGQPAGRASSFAMGRNAGGFLWGALAWLVAVAVVLAWRFEKLPSWAPLVVTSIELGILYYMGTTQWGWAVALPSQSPVLRELVRRSPTGLIGGETENLPVRANLATAYPYIGFALPRPNEVLKFSQERLIRGDSGSSARQSAGGRSTALVQTAPDANISWLRTDLTAAIGNGLGSLARPAHSIRSPTAARPIRRIGSGRSSSWMSRCPKLAWLPEPGPSPAPIELIDRLFRSDDPDLAMFLAEDAVPARADATSARLISWDGSTATVEHEGTCDLVIARTFDRGWLARIGDGPEQPVLPVDGGFQAVRVEGSGTHRVEISISARRFSLFAAISLAAAGRGRRRSRGALVARVRSTDARATRASRHGLSFSSSPPIVSMSEAISRSLKSNLMPAAAKSSGSGREPPSASAFL